MNRIPGVPGGAVLGISVGVAIGATVWILLGLAAKALADEPPVAAVAEELDPKLARARRYNRRLERVVHRLATRAERHERTIRLERHATRRALGTSPVGGHWIERAFLCIHEHEGSWRDPGVPYFGGLQMDLDFQRAYGREYLRHYGTADNWPMSVQLAVAIKAWMSRGFHPWPNTARRCGLL